MAKKVLKALERYSSMRDFKKTREPPVGTRAPRRTRVVRKPIFVIQEHHATRLHYDFRLEAEGVLKSWAVTNEPTLDPSVKRLAIEVEDHPLDYAGFKGEIPKGEYGAGVVKIWDRGSYELLDSSGKVDQGTHSLSEAIKMGKIKIRMQGRKMKGSPSL